MARAGILYSDVARAATELAAKGEAATVDNVRKMMGDTGSKSTIAPMLKRGKRNIRTKLRQPNLVCLNPF
jgi:hypothetical protein